MSFRCTIGIDNPASINVFDSNINMAIVAVRPYSLGVNILARTTERANEMTYCEKFAIVVHFTTFNALLVAKT